MRKNNYLISNDVASSRLERRYTIDNPGPSMLSLSLGGSTDPDESIFHMSYSASYSYRDRKKGLNEFRKIIELAEQPLTIQPEHTRVQIKLFFEKKNPYYGLILRKVAPTDVLTFKLSFKSKNGGLVSASSHTLQLDYPSLDLLESALDNLIVVANV
jgi:hypothetical protein